MSRLALSVLAGGVVGFAGLAGGGTVDLPRFPAVSPDGSEVVFSWGGDLWKASTADRGEARAVRLTTHPMNDLYAAWSPDGERIAFSTDREGGMNVWVMNADGSGLERWTQTDRAFVVSQWAEGGIYGHGSKEGDTYREPRPYVVDDEHMQFSRAHDAFGRTPRVSADGDRVLFERGYNSWSRRHYRGPADRDVFLYDASSDRYTQVTSFDGNDGHAHFVGGSSDRIAFLSDRELDTVNLYTGRIGDDGVLDAGSVRRVTGFEGKDVHGFSLSADGETAVVAVWDTLYVVDMGDRSPRARALSLTASEDDQSYEYRLLDVTSRATDAALSPDGKVMAVVAYGDVWVKEVGDDSPSRRVTDTAARETSVAWSPDGTRLYFASDMAALGEGPGEGGASSIYAATVALTRGEITARFEQKEEEEQEEAGSGDDASSGDAGGAGEVSAEARAMNEAVGGVWSVTIGGVDTGGGAMDITGEIVVSVSADGSLGVTMTVMGAMDVPISGASFADGVMQVSGEYMGQAFEVQLNVSGDSSTGSWSAGGMSGPVSGTRTAEGSIAAPAVEPAEAEGDGDAAEEAEEKDTESNADDPKRWHDAIRFDVEAIVVGETNDRNPVPSPDGLELSFQRGLGTIVVRDLFTGDERVILDTWNTRIDWRWSPDGDWIAYSTCDMDFNYDVFVTRSDGSGEAVNITMHPDTDASPRWSADSKVLAFVSERTGDEYDVWAVYLDKSLDSMNDTELRAYYEEAKKDAREVVKPVDPIDWTAAPEGDDEAEGREVAELDLDDAYLRLRRITRLGGNEGNLELTPGGDRFVFSGRADSFGLYSVDWRGEDRKSLGGGASVRGLSRDGGKVVLIRGGRSGVVNAGGGGADTYSIGGRIRIDTAAESRQKFAEMARTLGDEFYHPTMKDLDWAALSAEYGAWAENARTPNEFAWVASNLLGELNGSHLGVTPPSPSSDVAESNGRLGIDFTALPVADGRVHYRVDRVLEGGPAFAGPMALKAGDVITGVEFEDVRFGETLGMHLRGRVGDETVISIDRPAAGGFESFELIVTPISYGAESGLRYADWQARRRAWVDEWSGGRLGYLHIQGMSQPSLEEFERDLFAAAYGKDGLIVDVRSNGGGWTTDRILSSIMVEPHSYTVSRGADLGHTTGYPRDRLYIQRYTQPMSVLCNQQSFSNAEIFSHAFKTLGRGTLVGEQTFGGVISTGAFSLIDGTRVRLPFRGWYLPDGTDMENNGAMPDLVVIQTPEDEARDEDRQLRAAVDELLGRL